MIRCGRVARSGGLSRSTSHCAADGIHVVVSRAVDSAAARGDNVQQVLQKDRPTTARSRFPSGCRVLVPPRPPATSAGWRAPDGPATHRVTRQTVRWVGHHWLAAPAHDTHATKKGDSTNDVRRRNRATAGDQSLASDAADAEHRRRSKQRLPGTCGDLDDGHEAIFIPDVATFSPEAVQGTPVFGSARKKLPRHSYVAPGAIPVVPPRTGGPA